MTDAPKTPSPAKPPTPPRSSASSSSAPDGSGQLQTEKGTTTIAEVVVTKVAGIAAREVNGVHSLGGTVARAINAVTQRLSVGDSTTQGVNVEVNGSDCSVSMNVIIDYGESIPNVAQAIRDNVVRRIEGTTGLDVSAVDITVTDLYFPGDDDDDSTSSS